MSVLSRKRAAETEQGRLRQLAWVAVAARAAAPMAKTAGMAAQDGARSAATWTVTWATPRVNGARAWTAPRIERGGLVLRDTVGPRISDVLTATARRVDVATPGQDAGALRRRWPRVLGGTALLAGAGAVVAIVLRRRKDDGTGGAPGPAAEAGSGPQTAGGGEPGPGGGEPGAGGGEPGAGGDAGPDGTGQGTGRDNTGQDSVSGQFPAT